MITVFKIRFSLYSCDIRRPLDHRCLVYNNCCPENLLLAFPERSGRSSDEQLQLHILLQTSFCVLTVFAEVRADVR